MFGTIRKHSKWLWLVVIALTIIAFIYWGAGPGSSLDRPGGGRVTLGSIHGEPVTIEDFAEAQREVQLQYFLRNGQWPNKGGKRLGFDEERETYIRLLIIRKLEELGIHAKTEAVAKTASQLLRSFNRGEPLPLEVFSKQILAPARMTVQDFQRYLRHELGIQQLIAMAGLNGELVTPQEVRALYARENEELSVQAVFFNASNHLASVTVTPEAVSQFYTNQMPRYRLPERVQVSYVKFLATNFWEEAVQEINQITNLTEQLEQMYQQSKTNLLNATTSPEEFKQNILKEEQRKVALSKARKQANAFATELFDMPVQAENLEALAKSKGLAVEITEPFSQDAGPKGLQVGEEFANMAFKLTAVDPFAGEAILGFDEAYVVALKARVPSENPLYESVRERVTDDYRFIEALRTAHKAGEEFYVVLTNGLAAGKGFVTICSEAGRQPVLPPPFSLSTRELPEVEKHVNLQQLKQAAFTASVGKPSEFIPTREGGFIVFVQARLPLDIVKMNAALTNFTRAVRQARQNEAFNAWFSREAERGLRDIPYFARQQQPQSQPPGMPPQ